MLGLCYVAVWDSTVNAPLTCSTKQPRLCVYIIPYTIKVYLIILGEREDRFNFAIARREPFFKQIIPLDSEVRDNTRYTNAVSFPADIGGLRSKINIFTAVYPFDFLSD